MNRCIFIFIEAALLCFPVFAFASCSTNGATIVYVNGIETTQQEAEDDTKLLHKEFLQYGGSPDTQIITGYNPTHLNGLDDEIESIAQAFGTPISDLDLDTILAQIAPEITTRKILLVGHSQGAFYANELYDYLVHHGEPSQSIAVYALATPASFVAGNGTYLTSANDALINQVRVWDAEVGVAQPLAANILIPPQPGDASAIFAGHSFGDDYLTGAAARIVSDIENAIGVLSASGMPEDAANCFEPPQAGISDIAQEGLFFAADPLVGGIDYATADAANTLTSVNENANDILQTFISDAVYSIFPKPSEQNAGAAFSVEKALYGSSLSESDYEALLSGQNPEEVDTPPPSEAQAPVSDQPQTESLVQQNELQPTSSHATPPVANATSTATIPMSASPTFSVSPGFGGGGGAAIVSSQSSVSNTASDASATSSSDQAQAGEASSTSTAATSTDATAATSTDAQATSPLMFSVVAPEDQSVFSTSTVAFSGTTSPQALVFASFGTTSTSTSADQNGMWSLVLTFPVGTTTVSLSAANASSTSATSSLTVGISLPARSTGTALGVSPVVDSFDTQPVGWNNYADNWRTSSWDVATSDCYSGSCLSETSFNQPYENIKYGTALQSGSFVIYFRNEGYSRGFGVGVCTEATSSECESDSRLGGSDALLYQLFNTYLDNAWHYLYFAFRDGDTYKEYCGMVDDDNAADCSWQPSTTPSGTSYSGVLFFTGNGLNTGAAFYWDELTNAPETPS